MSSSKARATVAVGVTVLSVLGSTVWPSSAASPTAMAGAAVADTALVSMGTYNIRAGVSTDTFKTAVEALKPRVDVAGLQEVNSKDKEAVLAGLDGWGFYRPDRFRGEQNPVIWRKDVFDVIDKRSVRVAGQTDIGNEIPGKSRIGKHYAVVVRLEHRGTGRKVSIINQHLPPGAVKAGQKVVNRPKLWDRYTRELAKVADVVDTEDKWGRVFVMGDFNAGWVPDRKHRLRKLPFRTFRGREMPSMWATGEAPTEVGTHNDALIDQIFSTSRAASAKVFDINYSDHRPGIAEYEL